MQNPDESGGRKAFPIVEIICAAVAAVVIALMILFAVKWSREREIARRRREAVQALREIAKALEASYLAPYDQFSPSPAWENLDQEAETDPQTAGE